MMELNLPYRPKNILKLSVIYIFFHLSLSLILTSFRYILNVKIKKNTESIDNWNSKWEEEEVTKITNINIDRKFESNTFFFWLFVSFFFFFPPYYFIVKKGTFAKIHNAESEKKKRRKTENTLNQFSILMSFSMNADTTTVILRKPEKTSNNNNG